MGSVTGQYTFTVPTKGLCIMCLTDNLPAKTEEVSIQSIKSYLKLDYRKIFNISQKLFADEQRAEVENLVDIKVTLCRSCSDLRNKFCDLYDEMEAIRKKLSSCAETMLEVMLNAESNVIRSRRYRQQIAGTQENYSEPAYAVDLIKKSIPEKFRKETMQKCVVRVETDKVLDVSNHKEKEAGIIDEDLELELFGSCNFEDSQNYDYSGRKNAHKEIKAHSDEDEAMKIDEDADPEELMNRFDASADKFKYSINGNDDASGYPMEAEGNIWDESGVDEDLDEVSAQGLDIRTTFNSKYKCNVCGKVVVSLKNFELHQRRHTGEKPFACPFCEQHFRDTSNLRSHALRYHRQYLFANFKDANCDDEHFKVALDKIVQSLVRVSEGGGSSHQSHKCYLCHKEYTQKYAIEDHIVQRHYDVLSTAILHLQKDILSYESEDIAQYMVQIQESGETCTICGHCGQQFQSGLEVNSHMKVHVKVKVARSQGAVKSSDTADSLIQLKMKCNFCSKYFEDLHALTMHKTIHQGNCASSASRESIYNCEHCGRSFCSYYSQRSHVLSFHRYQVFSRYLPPGTTAPEIESVVKQITGKYTKLPNGLFRCSLCPKEITQLRKLQSHILVTHFDEVVVKLKVAIHLKNGGGGNGDAVDQFEDNSNSTPFDESGCFYDENDDDDNTAVVYNENGDASENLEVVISYPE